MKLNLGSMSQLYAVEVVDVRSVVALVKFFRCAWIRTYARHLHSGPHKTM